jgi:hypothetical protein
MHICRTLVLDAAVLLEDAMRLGTLDLGSTFEFLLKAISRYSD